MRLQYINKEFAHVVAEGFRFEPAINRADYEERIDNEYVKTVKKDGKEVPVDPNAKKKFKAGSRRRLADYLREKGNFIFSDTDRPDDFIFIEPVMKSQTIPIKPRDPKQLSTFEGSKISYGFTVRDPAGYSDKLSINNSVVPEIKEKVDNIISVGWPPYIQEITDKVNNIVSIGWPSYAQEIMNKADGIVNMGWPYADSIGKIVELGWPTSEFKELTENDMNLNTLKRLKAEWSLAMPRMKRDSGFDFSEYQEYLTELDKLIKYMSSTEIDNLNVLKSADLNINDLMTLRRTWSIALSELDEKRGRYSERIESNVNDINMLLNLMADRSVQTIKQLIKSYKFKELSIGDINLNVLKKLKSEWDRATPQMKIDADIDDDIENLIDLMEAKGVNTINRLVRSYEFEPLSLNNINVNTLKKLRSEWDKVTSETKPDSDFNDNIDRLLDLMDKKGVETITQLIRSYSEETSSASDFGKYHLKRLQTAFIKMVKKPEPREAAVQQKFVEYGARVFTEKNKNEYDVIMYPQSSSTFNKNFADILSPYLVNALVYEIPKRKVKEVVFNYEEMMKRAAKTEKKISKKLGKIPTDKEWIDEIVDNIRSSFPKDENRTATMKNQRSGDKRRYAQLFKMEEPELFQGASILVIDDNVVHQGTFEMIHGLLSICSPSRIDMYTPFYYRSL
jgi:hypothetical protein